MLTENKTTICNKALSFIGEEPINSLEDNSTRQARACNAYFNLALHKVLEEGHWSFVTVEEPLQKINYAEYSEEQKYVYAIPNNATLITRIYKRYNRKNLMAKTDWDFRFIEDLHKTVIICNEDNVSSNGKEDKNEALICEYVRFTENFSSYPAVFLESLIVCLAYLICMDITKDVSKTNSMMQLYETLQQKALRKNFNEDKEDQMHWVDPITNSRGL